ncbi:MAG: hypothetical protein M3R57_02235 [Chloroflexota bacterium]|nr:hypothetical protein [Chloroflexota bacterium]
MTRVIDRGALVAASVGIGVAVTIGVSFLLIIPIEPIYWLLTLPAGLLIGYYANQRADRRAGPWPRIVANALFAAALTGATMALLLLGVKALFFFADNGYRDPGLGGQVACQPGPDCVYRRYLDAGRGPDLASAGVTDAASFSGFYWSQQLATAGLLFGVTTAGGLGSAVLYGLFRPKPLPPRRAETETQPAI